MDLSLVAAVGSFVVSERVLKPKATVLVILGFVLAYDLTTKTQDVSSLRVYRGPSLVALTLMMVAYSLRMWRRNGIACDELIFLPGTQHGHQIGIEGPLIESIPSCDESDSEHETYVHNSNIYASISPVDSFAQTQQPVSVRTKASEGINEATAGADSLPSSREGPTLEMISLGFNEKEGNGSASILVADGNDGIDINYNNDDLLMKNDTSSHGNNIEEGNRIDEDDKKSLLGVDSSLHTAGSELDGDNQASVHNLDNMEETTTENPAPGSPGHANTNGGIRARLRQWFERYPHLARLWSLFFNRSGGSNNANAAYAPSGPAVFGAALDLSMPVLFNFHVFILTFNHIQRPDYTGSDFYAKTLPIVFLAVLYARVVIPPARRLRFWGTMKFTFAAPFFRVGVRDEFIGECLTSWVRIGQDLVFATIYFFIVIWGTISRRYSLTESGEILAESWYVHNIILPLFAILPLWLKYLQTLRQAYDANRRWPYLGNAFKYLSAALVIIYGTAHPDRRKSRIWIACFIFAMFYQIFWDVVMDWQLFEIPTEISVVIPGTPASTESSTISSVRPSFRVLLSLQMYVVQPIQDCCHRLRALLSGVRNIQLRERRLYKTKFFYWKILAYNVFTRFTWMCCFIPAYHVSRATETVVLTSTYDVTSYWGVLLPAAELFRRTLWGFLYLEKETIKMMEVDSKYQQVAVGGTFLDDDVGSDEITINSKVHKNRIDLMPTWLGKQQQVAHNAATSRAKRRKKLCRFLYFLELCAWAAGFVILGGLVAM